MLCKHCGRLSPEGKTCLLCGTPVKGNKVSSEDLKEYEKILQNKAAEEAKYEEERQAKITAMAEHRNKIMKIASIALTGAFTLIMLIVFIVSLCLPGSATVHNIRVVENSVGNIKTMALIIGIFAIICSIITTLILKKNKFKYWYAGAICLALVFIFTIVPFTANKNGISYTVNISLNQTEYDFGEELNEDNFIKEVTVSWDSGKTETLDISNYEIVYVDNFDQAKAKENTIYIDGFTTSSISAYEFNSCEAYIKFGDNIERIDIRYKVNDVRNYKSLEVTLQNNGYVNVGTAFSLDEIVDNITFDNGDDVDFSLYTLVEDTGSSWQDYEEGYIYYSGFNSSTVSHYGTLTFKIKKGNTLYSGSEEYRIYDREVYDYATIELVDSVFTVGENLSFSDIYRVTIYGTPVDTSAYTMAEDTGSSWVDYEEGVLYYSGFDTSTTTGVYRELTIKFKLNGFLYYDTCNYTVTNS